MIKKRKKILFFGSIVFVLAIGTYFGRQSALSPRSVLDQPDKPRQSTVPPSVSPTPADSTREKTPILTFAVVGDNRDGDEIYKKIIDQVSGSDATFLAHVGDMVAHGYDNEWAVFKQIQAVLKMPFYAAPGNHDVFAGRDPYQKARGSLYFSFNNSGWHFIFLDNARGLISETQMSWLKTDLAKNKSQPMFIFMHQPPISKFSTHTMAGDSNQPENARSFLALIKPYNVQAIFSGHVHAYSDEPLENTRLIISGGGGSPIYLPEFLGGFYHWLKVKVYSDRFEFEINKIEG